MSKAFTIKHRDKETKARAGVLKTKSGDVETPFFMPVATKASAKYISSQDLKTMGAGAIICNSFILSLRPGVDLVGKMGGLGRFMSYSGCVFTDSGGFQMYSPSMFIRTEENGIVFKNPFSGEKCYIKCEDAMDIQLGLGSDVAMCLDSMPMIEESKESIAKAVEKTTQWARQCKEYHDAKVHGKDCGTLDIQKSKKKQQGLSDKKSDGQLLFGIIQGGIHDDLREKSAKALLEMDFVGYSIGGLALGEPKEDEYRMIDIVKGIIPEEKPIYLMGAGEPVELLEAISRGVDCFDSRFPTQNARRGSLFTWKGSLKILNKEYAEDNRPIDKHCECFVCENYSRAYVRHLLKMDEGNGLRLASYHNLYFLQELLRRARMMIEVGKFDEFKKEFIKYYSG